MKDVDFKKLEKKITPAMENKWFDKFGRESRYMGNGVYVIPQTNLCSNDTRKLFLMYVAAKEGIVIS